MATNLALPLTSDEHLAIAAMETWLWDAACTIRGAADAPKFKDFILPLIFFKRLSDVFDDEFQQYVEQYGSEEAAHAIVEADHRDALREGRRPIVRFYIPREYRWDVLRNHGANGQLGEFVTEAMRAVAALNPELKGVLDVKDWNERQSGQRTLDDDRLSALIEVIHRHRLGLRNTEPDVLGRAYEYLLRKFAEGQGQSAGEFYTPTEVGFLMARLIDPEPYTTVYDPTCGSGGLLVKARMIYEEHHPEARSQAPRIYGQELNPVTYALAKMNAFLHDYTDAELAIGDTFRTPRFTVDGKTLERFRYVVANPMWNQDNYDDDFYKADSWGRFAYGWPPKSSADWSWVQHMFASLEEQGRAAIVLDTGAVSRGSGSRSSNREKQIRKQFVENDWIEGVVLLPENLFYNTTAPGIILLLNRHKPQVRQGQIIMINASPHFVKQKPKNVLSEEGIAAVVAAYETWESREFVSRILGPDEIKAADYNLSPSQFVDPSAAVQHRPLADILEDLALARVGRGEADKALDAVMSGLNLAIT